MARHAASLKEKQKSLVDGIQGCEEHIKALVRIIKTIEDEKKTFVEQIAKSNQYIKKWNREKPPPHSPDGTPREVTTATNDVKRGFQSPGTETAWHLTPMLATDVHIVYLPDGGYYGAGLSLPSPGVHRGIPEWRFRTGERDVRDFHNRLKK